MATATPTQPQVFNLPNNLPAARFGLSIVLFVLIELSMWLPCVGVFALAALTDYLDGYFARKYGITSTLGRNLDPLVDKVLICGAYIFLLPFKDQPDKVGAGLHAWMVTLIVSRELIITGLRSFMEHRGGNFGADWLGKLKMGLQCAALFAIFIAMEYHNDVLVLTRDVFVYAMLAATALSGIQYLWRAASLLKVEPTP